MVGARERCKGDTVAEIEGSDSWAVDTCSLGWSPGMCVNVTCTHPPVLMLQIAFFWSLICTGARRNPATCGATQKKRKIRLFRLSGRKVGAKTIEKDVYQIVDTCSLCWSSGTCIPPHQPSELDLVAFLNCLDVYHRLPDCGERQHKSRTEKCELIPL